MTVGTRRRCNDNHAAKPREGTEATIRDTKSDEDRRKPRAQDINFSHGKCSLRHICNPRRKNIGNTWATPARKQRNHQTHTSTQVHAPDERLQEASGHACGETRSQQSAEGAVALVSAPAKRSETLQPPTRSVDQLASGNPFIIAGERIPNGARV